MLAIHKVPSDAHPAAVPDGSPVPPDAGEGRALRALVFTSLFPSRARPRHGIFVETRLTQLIKDCPVDARVVAPVPWFPSASRRFGAYAAFAATPRTDSRGAGLAVTYPRYWMLPRLGVALQPDSMARGAFADVQRLLRSGWRPHLIDAHYLYPDGVAAAIVARRLGVPLVMTARGTDVNVLAEMPGPRRRIVQAAADAGAIITVSQSLKTRLVALGVVADKIVVLRNGVDLELFRADDRSAARQWLGLPPREPLLLNVGNLVPEKGQLLALQALQHLPGYRLMLVGDGPQRAELLEAAQRLGLGSRVLLKPVMPQQELRQAYSAADALLLTSTREGWPNVVLESIACGTPVVAVDVGGVREMITDASAGRVIADRDPAALAAAVREVLAEAVPREQVRRHATQFDWTSISRGQYQLFRQVVAAHR